MKKKWKNLRNLVLFSSFADYSASPPTLFHAIVIFNPILFLWQISYFFCSLSTLQVSRGLTLFVIIIYHFFKMLAPYWFILSLYLYDFFMRIVMNLFSADNGNEKEKTDWTNCWGFIKCWIWNIRRSWCCDGIWSYGS